MPSASTGRLAEAEALQRQVATRLETISGAHSEEPRQALERLAETLRALGKGAEAESAANRARTIATEIAVHREAPPTAGP